MSTSRSSPPATPLTSRQSSVASCSWQRRGASSSTEDPTALSYVLTALVQVDLTSRQALLEAPTTVARLLDLERLLVRETWFLRQGLRPIIIDAAGLERRAG